MIDGIFYVLIIMILIVAMFIIALIVIKSTLYLLSKKIKVIGQEIKTKATDVSNEINKLK